MSYRAADGRLVGFAIDVLNEAARREKISVEWTSVRSSKDSEDDLRSGRVDLLPAGMITPERRQMFYVSEPWWSNEMTLVSRVDHPVPNRIGINPIYGFLAKGVYPKAALVQYPWADWAVKAACKGEVDAALLARGEVQDILLNRPEECGGVRLASGDTTALVQLALIARKSDKQLALRLRRRIDEMAWDGTLMRLAVQNPPISIASVSEFEEALRDRFTRRLWITGGSIAAVFLLWFLWDRQRDLARAKRSEGELRKLHDIVERTNRTMELAMDAGNSGAWTWNISSGELIWTDSYRHLLGVPADAKPTPELFYAAIHSEDVAGVRKSIEDCLEGRQTEFCTEFRIRRSDGLRWIERRGRVFRDENGAPLQMVGISADITERKILRGLLSTCAQCKKIKDEHDHWQRLERYISEHSEARLSHGLCPECATEMTDREGLGEPRVAGSVG